MILDNRGNGNVAGTLKKYLAESTQLHIITRELSLFGYEAIKDELNSIEELKLLCSLQGMFPDSFDDLSPLHGSIEERPLRNKLTSQYLAREMDEWLDRIAEVRTTSNHLNTNYYHVNGIKENDLVINGSATLTSTGLGTLPSSSHEMNTAYKDKEDIQRLEKWFTDIWNNSDQQKDAKAMLSRALKQIYKPRSPELLYFQTLYHLFKDSLDLIDEENVIKSRTGIKDTLIWNKLYKFQKDGVISSISKIEQYNGCIIADSVGLGKTYEALAIIKYYEIRNDRVLVLAPKKLRENWTVHTLNDKRNIFLEDRFNYDVLNHTDLTRDGGMSGDINLDTVNWGMYDLIVIDESHNFRNSPSKKDGMTRYGTLMNEIIKNGVKTKVLMLSATPVNNRMNDLKNQVAFITEGNDRALHEEGIKSIGETLKKAQKKFNNWQKLSAAERTSDRLVDSLNFDYFKLLDMLTIARSRKHITKYFNSENVGKFPKRLEPKNLKPSIDTGDAFPPLKEINRDIRKLNLAAYSPLKYLMPDKKEEYSKKYDTQLSEGSVFKQVDREKNLIHLMRVNLLKRLESSIVSFESTIEKLLDKVSGYIQKIESSKEVEELDIDDVDLEDEQMEPFLIGSKIKVLVQDLDPIRWKDELEEDRKILQNILDAAQEVNAANDNKLHTLKELIREKAENPINNDNKKALIFTAYADTADYLYQQLSTWAKAEMGLNVGKVTGGKGNTSTIDKVRNDFSSIISAFSPISKERDKTGSTTAEEIDILVSTDCLSEGQNLQDCDMVINYDIHWNPVRIIQRFGRIDRLGSKNDCIQLVNLWPNMELDEYINLEARVSGRMVLLDISATGEENVIEFSDSAKMNDLEYRKRQMEQLQDEVIDLEDLGGNISITDLTLNDFRMDLAEYLKEHEEELKQLPIGGRAFVQPEATGDDLDEAGVLFCLKSENDHMSMDPNYAVAPYYLVYVNHRGEVKLPFTKTKKLLDLFKQQSIGEKTVHTEARQEFQSATHNGKDMEAYQRLLAKGVQSISGKAEEKGVESLFDRGGTHITKDSFQGLNDFEVVSYLVISPEQIVA